MTEQEIRKAVKKLVLINGVLGWDKEKKKWRFIKKRPSSGRGCVINYFLWSIFLSMIH